VNGIDVGTPTGSLWVAEEGSLMPTSVISLIHGVKKKVQAIPVTGHGSP
jgi:hypothetical protein